MTPIGNRSRGYTLIELLVVVMIVIILVATALPVAKRVLEDSRTREASRQLTGHFGMARAYASRNNRPFGLWMEYDQPIGAPADVRQVTRIYLCEVQPPFAGGTTASRAIIRIDPGVSQDEPQFVPLVPVPLGGPDMNGDGIPDAADQDDNGEVDEDTAEKALLLSLLDEGEAFVVRFDFKGDWFRCFRGSSQFSGALARYADPDKLFLTITGTNPATSSISGTTAPPAYDNGASPGYRYQILRTPRRVGNPLELANGTCIDVEYSGLGLGGNDFGTLSNRLVVIFSPSGGIDGLYGDGATVPATGTLHFLVGRVEKVNQPIPATPTSHPTGTNMFDPAMSNLADPNSIWVSVGRQNGTATSTENTIPPVDENTRSATNVTIFPDEPLPTDTPPGRRQNLNPTVAADLATFVAWCRQAATGREQMGGQ